LLPEATTESVKPLFRATSVWTAGWVTTTGAATVAPLLEELLLDDELLELLLDDELLEELELDELLDAPELVEPDELEEELLEELLEELELEELLEEELLELELEELLDDELELDEPLSEMAALLLVTCPPEFATTTL
jgi:hypothetical protein